VRNRYVLAADLGAIVLSLLGAFVLRLDWFFQRLPEYTAAFDFALGAALVVKPIVFYAFGLYRRYWRYAGLPDLLVIVLAVSASAAAVALVIAGGIMAGVVPFFPRSILALDWLLTLACVGGIRVSIRLLSESFDARQGISGGGDQPTKRVLIAGAGDAGAMVVREIRRNPQLGMRPIGFLDDQPVKLGKHIYEIPVLGTLADLETVVEANRIDQVVVAMPKAGGAIVRTLFDACHRAGVEARAVPGMFELLEGGVSVSRLREIDITDLLRRQPIHAAPEAGLYLQGKTVLVTGAGGSIGSELCRQLARAQVGELILLGHGENSIFDITNRLRQSHPGVTVHPVIADVRDKARIEAVFAAWTPSIVFHAAAHKHVPLMEAHPEEAISNNVLGTAVVVGAAIRHDVERFVLISTDKAVAPTSVMGASKRLAERIVAQAAERHRRMFIAVRFGNVLGSRGSVVPYFQQQIDRGGPITITHPDMRRFFMTIPEAVHLVVKAGGLASGGELFVLNMGEPVRIVDLAEDLKRLSGVEAANVAIVYTGLRPGEKLEEQLWEPGSLVEAAADDDEVFTVVEPIQVGDGPAGGLDAAIARLEDAAARGDALAIHELLSECLPTFVSSWHQGLPRPRQARPLL
jgi:FlaA1/EpsC-like NDP-sugar epimerase